MEHKTDKEKWDEFWSNVRTSFRSFFNKSEREERKLQKKLEIAAKKVEGIVKENERLAKLAEVERANRLSKAYRILRRDIIQCGNEWEIGKYTITRKIADGRHISIWIANGENSIKTHDSYPAEKAIHIDFNETDKEDCWEIINRYVLNPKKDKDYETLKEFLGIDE